ncbi:MAG: hypothetical protein ACXVCN_19820, partial [Bdellovibrio sp.]
KATVFVENICQKNSFVLDVRSAMQGQHHYQPELLELGTENRETNALFNRPIPLFTRSSRNEYD